MVISVIPENELFERRVICLPEGISWQFEVRMDYYCEGDEATGEEEYSEYGLYLTSSDGLEALIFHSQSIEHQIFTLNATDEAVRWLFDHLVNEIGFRVVASMAESKQLVEIGSVVDRGLEDWSLQLTHQSKTDPKE